MIRTALLLVRDLLHFMGLAHPTNASSPENLFLRKQPAFYVERKVKPRRLNDATRIALTLLARLIDWRPLLVVVRPETVVAEWGVDLSVWDENATCTVPA